MVYTAVEIIAGVFAIASLVKIFVIIANKNAWLNTTKKVYENTYRTKVFLGIIALLLFLFLTQSLTIVEIVAVMAFTTVLIGFELMEYPKESLAIAKKAMSEKMSNSQLIYLVFWIIIMILAFLEVFF